MSYESAGYEILEHTADIGLRAHGGTLEELFQNAAWGLVEILDAARPARVIAATGQRIVLGPADIEALLVDWMNELILLTEEGKACLGGVQVDSVGEEGLQAGIELVDCDPPPEGTELKAATYHQLSVRQRGDGWVGVIYFDV
jgi:SHS2 domain-containing protein